jgi:hypothetical protein
LRDSQDVTQEWSHCVDARAGYDVEYPADWHRGGTVEDPGRAALLCRFFDPEPFAIPPSSDVFGTALEVGPVDQTFDDALASLIDTRFNETVRREPLSLQGRHRAFRLELVATGEGLADRGTRTYGYLIRRLYGPPVFVRTTAARQEPLAHRAAVDRAASTIRLFAVPPLRPATLPEPVAEKHAAILEAAQGGDIGDVAPLADRREFTYTFGGEVAGGPAGYWRSLRARGDDPLEALSDILQMPYTLANGIYVWPFAYDKTPEALTEHERELLEPLETTFAGDSYLGWRAGIRPDGRWVFFVAGD